MKFITLNRRDIITSSYVDGQKHIDFHAKQEPVTINVDKIVSMIEYFDNDDNFIYTCINMDNTAYYTVTNRIDDIIEMINTCEKDEIKQVSVVGMVSTV